MIEEQHILIDKLSNENESFKKELNYKQSLIDELNKKNQYLTN